MMNKPTAQPVNHEKKLCSYCFTVLFLQLENYFKKATTIYYLAAM